MMYTKAVSIVIPVLNRATTIERCLKSIVSQTGIEQCEIIVVDNGSEDDTVEKIQTIAAADPHLCIKLIHESKRGASIARNRGLAIAEAPFTLFFDSDDEMLQGHLDRLQAAIHKHPQADIFGWELSYEMPDGSYYTAPFTAKNALFNHLCRCTLSTQRYAARTNLIRNVGGWDENLAGWDDYELGVRLLLASSSIIKLTDRDKPLVRTYFTESSITGRLFSSKPKEWENALDKIEADLYDRHQDLLHTVAYRRAILSGFYAREGAIGEGCRLLAKATAPGFGRAKALFCHWVIRKLGRGAGFISKFVL